MNWDAEINIEGERGVKLSVTLAEIQSILLYSLTKDELEEFARELIRWVELSSTLNFFEGFG